MMPVSHRVHGPASPPAARVATAPRRSFDSSTLAIGVAIAFALFSAALSFAPGSDDRAAAPAPPVLRGTLTALHETPDPALTPPTPPDDL